MIRSLMTFLAFNAFVLLLPVACFAAWGWGSPDEKWLMKVVFCALAPFCADLWYIILSGVFGRKPSWFAQFLIFVLGYGLIVLMLKSGMVRF
jgi:hypothetical protein